MSDVRVTIQEIARRAGVTHGTVSAVLNRRGKERRISPETQEHVLTVARQLKYTPNFLARGLRGGKTQTLGILMPGLYVEANVEKITAIEETAIQHGYRVFAGFHAGDPEREKKDIQEFLSRRVDGLIVFPAERTDGGHFRPLIEDRFPLVILGQEYAFGANTVVIDCVEVGRMAIRHLVEIGRRKIAFICGGLNCAANQARLLGWQQGCREAGLDFDALPFLTDELDDSTDLAARLTRQLIASGRPFDAIVASNDVFAMVAMKVLGELGLKVPQDTAVIGFDDNLFSKFLPVPLTTIRQPVKSFGETAFQVLLKHIENPDCPLDRVVLAPELVVRESTGGTSHG